MSTTTVHGQEITRLQYEAQGFKKAFFVLYNSFMNKEGCEPWMQEGEEGDGMAVIAVNGCFSIELYLKFLSVEATFDDCLVSGKHMTGHKLDELYDDLSSINPTYISDLENLFSCSSYKGCFKTLKEFLSSIKEYFVKWRYAYSSSAMNFNLNTMSDVINFLNDYSKEKYRRIADVIANNVAPVVDNQTMSIFNLDDIKNQ